MILHSVASLFSFGRNPVYIPMVVLEELDRFKKEESSRGMNSRKAIRILDELKNLPTSSPAKGIDLQNKGRLFIFTNHQEEVRAVLNKHNLDDSVPDNWILAVAKYLQIVNKDKLIVFVSKDLGARIKAWFLDIATKDDLDSGKKIDDPDELYSGYRELTVPSKVINEFYADDMALLDNLEQPLKANEFVLLQSIENPQHVALGISNNDDYSSIVPIPEFKDGVFNITPSNREQRMLLALLMDLEIKLITVTGKAGTGKTLLPLAVALELAYKQRTYKKIYVARPTVAMKGNEMGYLPGDKDDKLKHWLQPVFDNLSFLIDRERIHKGDNQLSLKKLMEEDGIIILEALAYIRGRTLKDAFIIIDEAQNLPPHAIKGIVTRVGEDSKIILVGDPTQIDTPYLTSDSCGLVMLSRKLLSCNNKMSAHITLKNSVRSNLAKFLADALESW